MLKITRFVVNPFQENTFVVYDETSHEAIVVDPGMFYPEERKAVERFISSAGLTLTQIVNTHLHLDHCFGAAWLRSRYNAPVAAHAADAPLAAALPQQALRFGMRDNVEPFEIDRELHPGDIIRIGDNQLEVIHVPGHTRGGIALYCKADRFVIVGDSLFKGSIGRTDLDGGDHATLIKAIQQGLMTLPDDTTVLSGHGEPTTIGYERGYNPYL